MGYKIKGHPPLSIFLIGSTDTTGGDCVIMSLILWDALAFKFFDLGLVFVGDDVSRSSVNFAHSTGISFEWNKSSLRK